MAMRSYCIATSPPTFYCPETGRVIMALFWGGWACYEARFENEQEALDDPENIRGTLNGNRVGVCEVVSHANAFLFGRDDEARLLTVVE